MVRFRGSAARPNFRRFPCCESALVRTFFAHTSLHRGLKSEMQFQGHDDQIRQAAEYLLSEIEAMLKRDGYLVTGKERFGRKGSVLRLGDSRSIMVFDDRRVRTKGLDPMLAQKLFGLQNLIPPNAEFIKSSEPRRCNLCFEIQSKELTLEHVPPEGSLEYAKMRVCPTWQARPNEGQTSRSAIKFRSTCDTCNNVRLGNVDSDLAKLCADVRAWLGPRMRTKSGGLKRNGVFQCNVRAVMKSVVGHSLAALTFTPRAPIDLAMRDFVMERNTAAKGFFVLAYAHTDRFVRILTNALVMDSPWPNLSLSHISWPPLGFIIVNQSGRFKNWPLSYLDPHTSSIRLRLMSPQQLVVWMNQKTYILGVNKWSSVIGRLQNETLP